MDTTNRPEAERVRVWLVERTYSDDEQNLIISTYATPDGRRYYRQERALTTCGIGNAGRQDGRGVEPRPDRRRGPRAVRRRGRAVRPRRPALRTVDGRPGARRDGGTDIRET